VGTVLEDHHQRQEEDDRVGVAGARPPLVEAWTLPLGIGLSALAASTVTDRPKARCETINATPSLPEYTL
jgi:hypothetical protein